MRTTPKREEVEPSDLDGPDELLFGVIWGPELAQDLELIIALTDRAWRGWLSIVAPSELGRVHPLGGSGWGRQSTQRYQDNRDDQRESDGGQPPYSLLRRELDVGSLAQNPHARPPS